MKVYILSYWATHTNIVGVRCVRDVILFFFSSRRRHTRFDCDWSSDVCSSDLGDGVDVVGGLGLLHAKLSITVGRDVGVVADHAHPECERPVRHELSDTPEADEDRKSVV